jgi:hypothetical protein
MLPCETQNASQTRKKRKLKIKENRCSGLCFPRAHGSKKVKLAYESLISVTEMRKTYGLGLRNSVLQDLLNALLLLRGSKLALENTVENGIH